MESHPLLVTVFEKGEEGPRERTEEIYLKGSSETDFSNREVEETT